MVRSRRVELLNGLSPQHSLKVPRMPVPARTQNRKLSMIHEHPRKHPRFLRHVSLQDAQAQRLNHPTIPSQNWRKAAYSKRSQVAPTDVFSKHSQLLADSPSVSGGENPIRTDVGDYQSPKRLSKPPVSAKLTHFPKKYWRRERDLNPRPPLRRASVFKTDTISQTLPSRHVTQTLPKHPPF